MRRWTKVAGLLASMVAVGALCAPRVGAEDWQAPVGTIDLLSPAYVPAPGHTNSVSAYCSGTDAIEVGLHPWDKVARNLQVFAADGSMLANVTVAEWAGIIPLSDHPARLVYTGTEYFVIATDRCAPAAPAPTTTAPPVTTGVTLLPPITVVAPTTTTTFADPVELDLAQVERNAPAPPLLANIPPLPATGVNPEALLLGITALGGGLILVFKTRRTHR